MAGVFKLVDSVDFFVQAQDASSAVLNISATATGSQASADITNTAHKGAVFFVTITSLAVASTIGVNINGKDPLTLAYMTLARVSLDGANAGAPLTTAFAVYPEFTTQASLAAGGSGQGVSSALSRVFQVVASVGQAGGVSTAFSYKIGMSKIL
jgi:hypothetical protein